MNHIVKLSAGRILNKVKFRFGNNARILMYHRIAQPLTDPWEIAVSSQNFEEHLKILSCSGSVITMDEFIFKIKNGKNLQGKTILTFDDGYFDNYRICIPLLEKYDIPATIFITDRIIGENRQFWWDELNTLILRKQRLPKIFKIEKYWYDLEFNLGKEFSLTKEIRKKNYRYTAFNPPTLRAQLYLKLWERINPLLAEEKEEILGAIRAWAGVGAEYLGNEKCMSKAQLSEIAKNPLITIGGHTHSHCVLSECSLEEQYYEIKTNIDYLENLIKKKITSFAYPFGKFTINTPQILKSLGIEVAFTTLQPRFIKFENPLLYGRYHVKDRAVLV